MSINGGLITLEEGASTPGDNVTVQLGGCDTPSEFSVSCGGTVDFGGKSVDECKDSKGRKGGGDIEDKECKGRKEGGGIKLIIEDEDCKDRKRKERDTVSEEGGENRRRYKKRDNVSEEGGEGLHIESESESEKKGRKRRDTVSEEGLHIESESESEKKGCKDREKKDPKHTGLIRHDSDSESEKKGCKRRDSESEKKGRKRRDSESEKKDCKDSDSESEKKGCKGREKKDHKHKGRDSDSESEKKGRRRKRRDSESDEKGHRRDENDHRHRGHSEKKRKLCVKSDSNHDADITQYVCPSLSGAGWDNIPKANNILTSIALTVAESKPRPQWTMPTKKADATKVDVKLSKKPSIRPGHIDRSLYPVEKEDEHCIIDAETARSNKLKFIQSSVGILLENINSSKDRYETIASLKANILPKENSFGLLDNAVFDVEPLRELPPLNSFQKDLINDAYDLVVMKGLSDVVEDAGKYYYNIRPARVFLEEANSQINDLCKVAADEDCSAIHDSFKNIFDNGISACIDAVVAWAERRDLSDDDREVYSMVNSACSRFNIARGSEHAADLTKAFLEASDAVRFINSNEHRANCHATLEKKLSFFISEYKDLLALLDEPVDTRALFIHLAKVSHLMIVAEIEKAINKLSCSEENKKDAALKDTIKHLIGVNTLFDKLSVTPMYIVDIAQLAIDTQISDAIRYAKHRKVSSDKVLELSLLIAATNFIDSFKASEETEHTPPKKAHIDMLDDDFNAYRIFCVGLTRLTVDLQPYDTTTDLEESVKRAIYQAFQAGMAGRLSTECLNNTPESTLEEENVARQSLFDLLRNLMEVYVSRYNEDANKANGQLLAKESAVRHAQRTQALREETVRTLKAKALVSKKRAFDSASCADMAELDSEALDDAEARVHEARLAAEAAAETLADAIAQSTTTFAYPYSLVPIVTKYAGLKILSNALSSNSISRNIFNTNSEITQLLHNLTSSPDNQDYIYDALGKIALWVSGDDCDDAAPASAQHVEQLARIVLCKLTGFGEKLDTLATAASVTGLKGVVDTLATADNLSAVKGVVDTLATEVAVTGVKGVVDTLATEAALADVKSVVDTLATGAAVTGVKSVVDTLARQLSDVMTKLHCLHEQNETILNKLKQLKDLREAVDKINTKHSSSFPHTHGDSPRGVMHVPQDNY